jgi:hypothetical protein
MAVDPREPNVLAAGAFLRHMLETTLDMWRTALPEEMTLAGAVITVVVDIEGIGAINVCVSHPMDEPEAIKRIAGETAEMLSKAL